MTDPTDPVQVRVPGPHLGIDGRWSSAALPGPGAPGLVGDATALRLPADPEGVLRLDALDGSLGRLTLPLGAAVDAGLRVFLLDRPGRRVLLHDPARPGYDPAHPFVPVPTLGGGTPGGGDRDDPRGFVEPVSLAARRNDLVVVDRGGRRVLTFAPDHWALRDVWSFGPGEDPLDAAAYRGDVYVLTSLAVYRHRPGDVSPRRVVARPAGAPDWRRLAVDSRGRVYLLRPASPAEPEPARLDVWDPGRGLEPDPVRDASDVRDRFPAPAVTTWPDESSLWYVIPAALTRPCGRVWPEPGLPALAPGLHPALRGDDGTPRPGVDFVVDSRGDRVDAARLPPPRVPFYVREGGWVSGRLDSKLYRCPWDVGVLDFAELSPGGLVEASTFTSDDENELDRGLPPEGAWAVGLAVTGTPRAPGSKPPGPIEFLIGSPPGRYLWFRLRMRGDGFASPALRHIDFRLPRQSYTQYLPAVFLEDEASRRFLERFLAVMQAEWDRLESRVDGVARLADPRLVPDSHVDFLAGWLGQTFENGWSVGQRRALLRALPATLFAGRSGDDGRPGGSRRGTPSGLRDYLRAVLLASARSAGPSGFPYVIEGFREREYRVLAAPGAGGPPRPGSALAGLTAGSPAEAAGPATPPLWGPGRVGRFRLGESSRLGGARLLPRGTPGMDVFTAHAHRFRVVMPAALVRDAGAEALVRRVIEAEKPAHTAYTLDLVGPRFRVGVQSTVGIDTILGGLPRARLGAAGAAGAAPSAPPRNRLGYDTVLSAAGPPGAGLRLGPAAAAGTL